MRNGISTPLVFALCALATAAFGQDDGFTAVRAEVDFSRVLRRWDGFGVNYWIEREGEP